jgi:hypothetical protein
MRIARTLSFVIAGLMLAAGAAADVKGWGLAAGVLDGDFGAQVRRDFWLGGDISQISGQASVYFHNKTTVRIDADYHFVITGKHSRFYPLAGLQFGFNSDTA